MAHKYENAHDWLRREGEHTHYQQLVEKYITDDEIQDLFQSEMDEDDFFTDMLPCAGCQEMDWDEYERTKCDECKKEFCSYCINECFCGESFCDDCMAGHDCEEEKDE